MVLEVALLHIEPHQDAAFVVALQAASPAIAAAPGYRSHTVHRCQETPGRYILLVEWDTLDDHLVGFRQSPLFQEWRSHLNPFYVSPPVVEHFDPVYP